MLTTDLIASGLLDEMGLAPWEEIKNQDDKCHPDYNKPVTDY